MLAAERVSFTYGDAPVLHDVSVTVSHGARVGILGQNGSGKTTLLKLLAGGLSPSMGTVAMDGAALSSFARRARPASE